MRTSIKITGVLAGTAIILAATVAPAMANTNNVSDVITAGNLSATTSDVTLSAITLDGATLQHATGAPAEAWTITDARGSGEAWSLSVSGSNFTSAAGTVDTTPRTILIDQLTIDPGTITAGTGSDAATTASPLTLSETPQMLIATTGSGKGTYSFTPGFDLSIPAGTFRSNFAGAAVDLTVNPYIAVITYTVS